MDNIKGLVFRPHIVVDKNIKIKKNYEVEILLDVYFYQIYLN